MLKVGLAKEESVVAQSHTGGCGCNKNVAANLIQTKENKLKALTEKMNKTKSSIYKTKAPIF